MILRDPVHGLVAFEGDAERLVQSLLDTREVQRLRRVRQLGLTSLVFPGAEHSRFAHAVGAAHVMARLQERVRARQEGDGVPAQLRLDERAACEGIAAALLHDLGHGPMSHLFEEVLPHARAHEEWTVEILLDESTEVHRALVAFDPDMPARVAALIQGTHDKRWLASSVSGVLDVDRCDYLLRDSHMTGVAYGIYDLDWLLRALAFAELPGGGWALAIEGRKGLPPIEGFFLARHFMYQQVYHHKATRAAECLVRAIFVRVAELIREGAGPSVVPHAMRAAVLGEPLSLERYLELDDNILMHCLAEWERDRDVVLADLARRLRRRELPKTVPLPDEPGSEPIWEEARRRAAEITERHGIRADLQVYVDVAEDVPYAEDESDPAKGLWVLLRHQPLRRLGDISFPLQRLRDQAIVRPRLCFPREVRDEVRRAIEEILK
ncbi:HD domain-containing protein [Sandaracinus amylolyticus]|uniref:HD domain-containing protein n=1 Tax=Sandaracinus amylolyticus TaxID=927083 RepID=UPI001F1CB74E|nr:HD domain-containing protein [Sandaracinus amylolyticus]